MYNVIDTLYKAGKISGNISKRDSTQRGEKGRRMQAAWGVLGRGESINITLER